MLNDTTLLLGLDGVSVVQVERLPDGRRRVHLVTADETARACPACGVFATRVKGSATTRPRDLPYGEMGLEFRWHKRRWFCGCPPCPRRSFYLYTPGGQRLLARNADGSTTAYLPGGNELTAAGAKVTTARYYTHGPDGTTVAVKRTGEGIDFLFPDQQGTALIAVGWGLGQAITRRKQLPFGGPRATSGSWPGERGFLSGTTDPTGTTHLGAREYDPVLGHFLSVDPLLVEDDQRQHNPYQYGNNDPVTYSDPTGEKLYDDITGLGYGNTTALKSNWKKQGYIDKRGKPTKKYHSWMANEKKRFKKYWNTCGQDPECNGEAAAERRAAAIKAAKRKEAKEKKQQNENKKSILGGLRKDGTAPVARSLAQQPMPLKPVPSGRGETVAPS